MTLQGWWEFINDLWRFVKKHNKRPHDWTLLMEDGKRLDNRHKQRFKKIIFEVIEIWENEERRD